MRKTQFYCLSATLAAIVLIVMGGCGGKSQPSRLYTLTPITEGQGRPEEAGPARNAAIGIGPVKLADYLDQAKIITRTGDNRIHQAQFDQWSGSFKDNLTNVLAENIGYLLESDRISIFPWRSFMPIDYQVTVDIVRCDGLPGKEVVLIARWSVLEGKEKRLSAMKRSEIRVETGTGGYQALVAAQSRALGRLSYEIVQAIQAADRKQQPGK